MREIRTTFSLSAAWHNVRGLWRHPPPRNALFGGPLRGQPLGAEHLAERARALAREQRLAPPGPRHHAVTLTARLEETIRILHAAKARLEANPGTDVGPAGEWLLDNFHVIDEQARHVRESLPKGYYRELPVLSSGALVGHPRVFELCSTLISHTEGRLDLPVVTLFLSEFQKDELLTLGELWAMPSMLRLGLFENVRRMALRTMKRLDALRDADLWVRRVEAAGREGAAALNLCLQSFLDQSHAMTPAFVSRFLLQLRHATGSTALIARLEQWMAEESLSPEEADAHANQQLALTQMVIANSIASLRTVSGIDWPAFVEQHSALEAALREDPAGAYARSTFETRDRYRHVVERIAKATFLGEVHVADAAVGASLAAEAGSAAAHVGYHLVDDGLSAFEAKLGYVPPVHTRLRRAVVRHPSLVLGSAVGLGTALLVTLVCGLAAPDARAMWLLIAAATLVPFSDVALAVAHQVVTVLLPPHLLPKLDLQKYGGIPEELRTLVVIPTLFGSLEAVREALETLEVQYLANREQNLGFALLGDFTDAEDAHRPGDDAIVAAACEGVRALNARYREGGRPFYLFHRPRSWSPGEGCFMGWERKRGKLADLNALLGTGDEQAFSAIEGDRPWLRKVRYVITLDADTVLPPEAAARLIGTIAHPLNRAVFDPERGRVVRGYGILQPRVVVNLPSAHASRFSHVYSGHPGVDPYTTAVSDLYQDLFGEGSYTGKGIYDVDVFARATRGRFPEGRLLSHDLIEGSFARSGLVTDVNVYDDYPSRYLSFTRRKHRWIRGDWQLLRWLGPRVPSAETTEPNPLSLVSRWKIFDNLRRSLVDMASLALIAAGWTVLPGAPWTWTAIALTAIAGPWIISLTLAALRPPLDRSWRTYYTALSRDAVNSLVQVGCTIAFLPHQAAVASDAIFRTLYRVGLSKRRLLQWETSQQVERAGARPLWRTMWSAPAWALALGCAGLSFAFLRGGPAHVGAVAWVELPLLGLWLASPALARFLSAPVPRVSRALPPNARAAWERYALVHWRFFETFVTEDTHGLAPDNFQETPTPVVAMRTSPTNIGLQLLATVGAHDLGFLSLSGMLDKLERAFASIGAMQKYKGHLYNWYDLRDLRVLDPPYVSTVDSGNLAGHLITLRQACLELVKTAAASGSVWKAMATALRLAAEPPLSASAKRTGSPEPLNEADERMSRALERVHEELEAVRASPRPALERLRDALRDALVPAAPGTAAPIGHDPAWIRWAVDRLEADLQEPSRGAQTHRLLSLAERAYGWALEMDFRFLYDAQRKLFAIGFHERGQTLDASFYDLLASESRLASFVAVAKGDAPLEHWFRLGRSLTHVRGATALVSWSGSMFEYLMPPLIMDSLEGTLLAETQAAAVKRQRAYGKAHGVPWGVSESAYNVRDRHFTYQYRAFGVPDLGLKRGLERDLVVAPYATAMAAMFDPGKALANLEDLEARGALGPYGLRDALDFTRPRPGQAFALVQTYMAHHIGMAFVALVNVLTDRSFPRRFHADSLVKASELMLHERLPRRLVLRDVQVPRAQEPLDELDDEPEERLIEDLDSPQPHIALLGRSPYTLMISHCGSGYSRYEDLAVTRWRADGTCDDTGQFIYVANVTENRLWSVAHQPVCAPPDQYRAVLASDRVTFHRVDGDIETSTEIATSSEDAAEVRRVTLKNTGAEVQEIELTSYGEIVLAKPDADRAHPAFSNLFVQTEWHGWCSAITATRRPRTPTDKPLWCVHVVDAAPEQVGALSCETDRSRFLGRGRTTRAPVALATPGPLSGTTGAVLDPIFALRVRVRVAPGRTVSVAFTTLVATSRERAFELADRHRDPYGAQRALDLAWTATQAELRDLGVTAKEAGVFQDLAAHLFYATPDLRAPEAELRRNRGSQAALWSQGISGDWPILLALIDAVTGLPTLAELLAAHSYWRRHGMTVDLVVLNTQTSGYLQELGDRISAILFSAGDSELLDRAGGVFVRRRALLDEADLLMLRATARVHVHCDGRALRHVTAQAAAVAEGPLKATVEPDAPGRLAERSVPGGLVTRPGSRGQKPTPRAGRNQARAKTPLPPAPQDATEGAPEREDRQTSLFDNGIGALEDDGRYRIELLGGKVPPAPWSNVVAGPRGGFVVSESGGGFCWAENSYFFRLTPWHNDPVADVPGEVIYVRDDETGQLWSATPAPLQGEAAFVVHHGAGFSTFARSGSDVSTKLTLGLAEEGAVKVSLLEVQNHGSRSRRLTLTSYVEWTLGVLREHTQHQVQTWFDAGLGAVLATNPFDPQFAGWVAFSASSEVPTSHSGDRRSFLGRNGSLGAPAALEVRGLDDVTGAARDPCAALQMSLEIPAGQTKEVVFLLGATASRSTARQTVGRLRDPQQARAAVEETAAAWRARLSVIEVETPEPSFDAMMNHWLLYQALSCRMWARSAVYQSSGAFGFRDQLQDAMALLYAEPALARAHILLAASRQFVEGDVQHWWHPQSGRGVRTRFSDDMAWLPYVLAQYIRVTGDGGILDEQVPFLTMRLLSEHEHELYDLPTVTAETATVHEHALRALRRACTRGDLGLPLMGIGDWNDGMNRVGAEGRGQSVWLAWFLATTARGFARHCSTSVAAELRAQADAYVAAAESNAWDGEWYRRAYFDDGTALGAASGEECRIDSIAQSWSVISGGGSPDRQARAMASLERHLVDESAGIVSLLDPPFDKSLHDPGYIKGYLPGVRENGAQYTHAALWAVLATALRGNGERAFALFQMLNPLLHAETPGGVATYKVEPYVVAADVYTAQGHRGRGGWTWYTGSASWMYRIGIETLLGLIKRGDTLSFCPRVPRAWPGFRLRYRFGKTPYDIEIRLFQDGVRAAKMPSVHLDGQPLTGMTLHLVDDGVPHKVEVDVPSGAEAMPA